LFFAIGILNWDLKTLKSSPINQPSFLTANPTSLFNKKQEGKSHQGDLNPRLNFLAVYCAGLPLPKSLRVIPKLGVSLLAHRVLTINLKANN
jgi:hypothetical protein